MNIIIRNDFSPVGCKIVTAMANCRSDLAVSCSDLAVLRADLTVSRADLFHVQM